jgi:polyphenol oxidase
VRAPFAWAGEHLRIDLAGGSALFTTRRGGLSEGAFASLNLGPWTEDDPAHVAANRERVRELAAAERLAQGRQVHGTRVAVDAGHGEEADGQVSTRAGVAEVHDSGLCTSCDATRFFSHRRDRGLTGRQAGVAWRT